MAKIPRAVLLGKGSTFYPPVPENSRAAIAAAKISDEPVCFSISRNKYVVFDELRNGEVFKVHDKQNNLYLKVNDE